MELLDSHALEEKTTLRDSDFITRLEFGEMRESGQLVDFRISKVRETR